MIIRVVWFFLFILLFFIYIDAYGPKNSNAHLVSLEKTTNESQIKIVDFSIVTNQESALRSRSFLGVVPYNNVSLSDTESSWMFIKISNGVSSNILAWQEKENFSRSDKVYNNIYSDGESHLITSAEQDILLDDRNNFSHSCYGFYFKDDTENNDQEAGIVTVPTKLFSPRNEYVKNHVKEIESSVDDIDHTSELWSQELILPDIAQNELNCVSEKNSDINISEDGGENNSSEMMQSQNHMKMELLYSVTAALAMAIIVYVMMAAQMFKLQAKNSFSVSDSKSIGLIRIECEACTNEFQPLSASESSSVSGSSLEGQVKYPFYGDNTERDIFKQDNHRKEIRAKAPFRDAPIECRHSGLVELDPLQIKDPSEHLRISYLEEIIQQQRKTILDLESEVETVTYKLMVEQHDRHIEKQKFNEAFQEWQLGTDQLVEWMKAQISGRSPERSTEIESAMDDSDLESLTGSERNKLMKEIEQERNVMLNALAAVQLNLHSVLSPYDDEDDDDCSLNSLLTNF